MKKKQDIVVLIGIILFFLIIVYIFYNKDENRNSIKENFSLTTGRIVNYYDRRNSDAGYISLEYEYEVHGKKFKRIVYTDLEFKFCENVTNIDCSKKRFWVIYSCKQISKSLVNLKADTNSIKRDSIIKILNDFY